MQLDVRTIDQKMLAELAEIKEQLHSLQLHRQRTDRRINRILELMALMEQRQLDAEDDLEMEPGVAVWTPVEIDE